MRRHGHAVLFALILAACSVACSEDETTSESPLPAGPASLKIVSPASGARIPEADVRALGLVVEVDLENYTLRPPGACFGARQCGSLRVVVDDGAAHSSASRFTSVPADSLATVAGAHAVRVDVLDDDGALYEADGGTLSATVNVEVDEGPDGGDSAVDASADRPSDALGDGGGSDVASDTTDARDASQPDASVDGRDASAEGGDASSEGGDGAPDSSSDGGDATSEGGDAPADVTMETTQG